MNPRPPRPTLQPYIPSTHQALPPPPHTPPVLPQTPRAILPIALRQLQLLKHQLNKQAIFFRRPLVAEPRPFYTLENSVALTSLRFDFR